MRYLSSETRVERPETRDESREIRDRGISDLEFRSQVSCSVVEVPGEAGGLPRSGILILARPFKAGTSNQFTASRQCGASTLEFGHFHCRVAASEGRPAF